MEALENDINNLVAPFSQAPPAHQGSLGWVTQGLGGALGVMSAPVQLADTGFAVLTADIAAMTPSLPAAVIGAAMHLGASHAHAHPPSLVPPASPVLLPSLGNIVLAGATNVLINGRPAARAGDVGIALTCGSLAPPAEIILGSSSVFIGGARAARVLDMTRHDNPVPVGVFAKAILGASLAAGALGAATQALDAGKGKDDTEKLAAEAMNADDADANRAMSEAEAAAAAAEGQAQGAALAAAQVAADAASMALQTLIGKDPGIGPGVGALLVGSPNVLIGGFPCPNVMESLKGLMKSAKGLRSRKRRQQDAERDGGTGPASCPTRKR